MIRTHIAVISIVLATFAGLAVQGEPSKESLTRPDSWETLVTVQQYDHFMKLVASDLAGRGLTPRLSSDAVTLEQYPHDTLGLDNLVRKCAIVDESKWAATIAEHFDGVTASLREQDKIDKAMANFDNARKKLRVRIYDPSVFPKGFVEQAVTRVDLEGTVTVLVLDMEKATKAVNRSQAKPWGKSDDELFDVATRNLAEQPDIELTKLHTPDGGNITLLAGDDFYASSHVLILAKHAGALGKFGTILVVPSREAILLRPIDDKSFLKELGTLTFLGAKLYDRDPGPISKDLFWLHDGKFTRIPYMLKDKKFTLQAPPEFEAMVQKLIDLATRPATNPSEAK